MRIIRHLICSKKHKSIKSESNTIDSGSDIRNRSKAAARLQQQEPIN
jgi:hypothetical protein